MIFETFTIQSPIDKAVDEIFYFKNFTPEHNIEKVVPTPNVFIIFELDGFERSVYNNTSTKIKKIYKNVWIAGVQTKHIFISAHQSSEMLIVKLKHYGSLPFLKLGIDQFTDKVIQGEEIFNEVLDIRDELIQKKTPLEKYDLIKKWLITKYAEDMMPPEYFIKTLKELEQNPAANFNQVISRYPHTQKHMINQFKKFIGLTPKTFHRILRFSEVLEQINARKLISWSQVSYACGFSDQAHFIREFRKFSGFNPSEFIKNDEHNSRINFFPIDSKG